MRRANRLAVGRDAVPRVFQSIRELPYLLADAGVRLIEDELRASRRGFQ